MRKLQFRDLPQVIKLASGRARIQTWSLCLQIPCSSYSPEFTWEKPFVSVAWPVVLIAFHWDKWGCRPILAVHSRWFTLGWNHWGQDRTVPVPDSLAFILVLPFLLALIAVSKLCNHFMPQFPPRYMEMTEALTLMLVEYWLRPYMFTHIAQCPAERKDPRSVSAVSASSSLVGPVLLTRGFLG